jgi:uncharacterized protein (TIGR04255 family)
MNLPRKITPDAIREAIVEIRYDSNIPSEILVGMLFGALDNSYSYSDERPILEGNATPPVLNALPHGIHLPVASHSFFYNNAIIVQLLQGSISFLSRNIYPGWGAYLAEISKFLQRFDELHQEKKYTRVGIRYIHNLRSVDLVRNSGFEVNFNFPQANSYAFQFKAEFLLVQDRVILQFAKKALESTAQDPKNEVIDSVLDIDVIREHLNESRFVELADQISKVHLKAKEIFYQLLRPEFLEGLQPEY